MKDNALKELIDQEERVFLASIDRELEKDHYLLSEDFGFPMFTDTAKEYREQVYYKSYLEHYVRNYINGILRAIIKHDMPDSDYRWPEYDYPGFYIGYNNRECEIEFGFEFINVDKGIGYRYSWERDDIEEVLKKGSKYAVEEIRVLTWEKNDDDPYWVFPDDQPIKAISVYEMFTELFIDLDSEELDSMYDLFIKRVSQAVKTATDKISLTSIPRFTPSYRHKSRKEVLRRLREEINSLSCFYGRMPKGKETQAASIDLISKYNLTKYFLMKGYTQALVGTSAYAKSFLTSEYLYSFFKRNPMLDYTPIVSGYLKSVEQLLDKICEIYRRENKISRPQGNLTLDYYAKFIESNPAMIRIEVQPAIEIIKKCIDTYRKENRNQLFHKHYLNSWEIVETIRSNTLFLYAVILGALDTDLINKDTGLLCLLRDRYEKLFLDLDQREGGSYTIVIDGVEYNEMVKYARLEGITYDQNGIIVTPVKFYSIGYEYMELVISPNRMPSEVWTEKAHGEKGTKIM